MTVSLFGDDLSLDQRPRGRGFESMTSKPRSRINGSKSMAPNQ
ncbi:hypothetical protein HMPREF0620_0544 [Parascardovia denticolens DSM 10105 = JCM 12538]|uniref:Uncharacterized protein n=1 Tax=Parascardovia denticolens DSM 10105 = JCM 12538 TaxID=864564 RepID=E6K158_PARDN|nr:hypothetical protein HMPREF0620_0544 [Parascardovia denticolens DSM 10105 = JCM 12538]